MSAAARSARPSGLVGVRPDWDAGIGCVVGVGIKGATGAPVLKDRFFLMSPEAHSADTSGPNKLRRDPLPAFAAWNERSMRAGEVRAGAPLPPTVMLRGVIVHAKLESCLRWNRSAYRAPNGITSPPSGRPWCEGNGVKALRIETLPGGEEREMGTGDPPRLPCPNEECEIAIKRGCKPSMSLLFMLRWDGGPEWQAGFPSILSLYPSHSWHTLRNALGLFALVLGTGAVMPWEPEDTWEPGLAAELGVKDPSLVGFPLTLTVGEKTQPAKGNQPGRRFPVVNFSQEGDLGAWLSAQIRRKQFFLAAGSVAPLALPPSLLDDELQPVLDLAHVEIEPSISTAERTGLKLASAPPTPEPLPPATRPSPGPRSPASEPVPLEEAATEPPPAVMTKPDITRLTLEAKRLGLKTGVVAEIMDAKVHYYGAGNVPASEAEKVLVELRRRAEAAKARPRS